MTPARRSAARLVLTAALWLSLAPVWAAGASPPSEHPVTTVRNVDLQRYVGLWYEIAKIPNRFQKQCANGTTATYSLRDDGRIDVFNQCVEEDGRRNEAKGLAKIVPGTGDTQLEVSFVSFLGWRPFWGDYWIIGLDEEYQWAVVGTPDRKYGWVLARTTSLDSGAMNDIFAILAANGYDRDEFEMSPH